ncbi:Ig-like domain-containing protein [Hafnia paralvei]
MSSLASALSSNGTDGIASTAKSTATGYASSSAQQWLSQFGTARVQLNVDDNGNWDDSAIDFLAPLYDNKKSMLFTQLGMRAPDGRVTGNLGMGVRTFYLENWMFGGNVFFDDDFTGKNRRVGVGAEAWTDNLKLSANTYVGTTDWHSSRDFDDYYEKPADGYDVRAEGYLPAYPQLGAKLMYEQYYGDKVALFDTDHLQSNPSAVTTGLSYTPIPLVQLAVNYKRGQDSLEDTQFQVNFRYDLGRPWSYQVNPENVRLQRSLAGSRYDLVERNNQIVLQYQKKDRQSVSNLGLQITVDNSPSDGLTPNSAQVYATDKDGQPVRNASIVWSLTGSAKLNTSSTVTNESGISTVNFTNTLPEAVQITAKSGAASATQNSQFNPVKVSNIMLKITKNNSIADGKTPNHAVATVTDINNHPIANTPVQWKIDKPATLKNLQTTTNASGQVTTDFTSTAAGTVILTAIAGDKSASQQGQFISDPANYVIDTMVVTQDGSPANGTTPNAVTVTVKDSNGAPVSMVNVTLSADKSTVLFGSTLKAKAPKVSKAFQTNSEGSLTVAFTDTVAESVLLTATLDNANTKTGIAKFIADSHTAKISALTVTSGAVANGTATNQATATVVDANGNPLSGVEVTWSQDGSALLGASPKTDTDGQTTVTFTDTKAQTVNITATVNNSSLSKPSTFIGDSGSVKVSALTVTSGAVANGTATNQATATVVDANGNPLSGVEVTWSQDGSALLGSSPKTDANGQTTVTFTDTKAQTVNITATVNNSSLSKPSTFIGDSGSAKVSALTVTSGAVANGTATNQAMATVIDAYGNPLSGVEVTWSQDGSALLGTSPKTDANGQTTVAFTDTKAQTVNITATANNSSLSKPSTFIGDSGSVKISALTVTSGAVANGTATNQATATVVDANGNPLSGVEVTWSQDGSAQLGTSPKTDANGQATVTFTDTKAQTVNITATVNNSSLSKPSTFIVDITAAVVVLNVRSSAVSDGNASVQVTAIVKDKDGNALPNFTLNWSVTDPYSNISSTQSVTDANGNAIVTVTNSSYIDKDVIVTATSAAADATNTAHFGSPLQGGRIVFLPFSNGSPMTTTTAGGQIFAHVIFSSISSPLPEDKTHGSLQGTSSSGATIANYAQTSNEKEYEALISNVTKSGALQATFQIGEYSLISPQLNIIPSSISESASHLELSQSSIPQGSSVVATLIAFDQYGNPGAISGNGFGVLLKLSKTIGINAPQEFTRMPDGSYQATIQTTLDAQVGALTISADPNGQGGGIISTSATITSNPHNAIATISPWSGQCTVGTPCRMAVLVKNSITGETMPSVTLTVKEATTTGAVISPDTVTSDGNGSDSHIYITSNTSGPIRVIAEINGSVESQPENEIIFSP